MVAMLVALHFSCGSQRIPDAIYDGYCGPGGGVPHYDFFTWTPTPPLPETYHPSPFPIMKPPSVLQRLASDAPRTFYDLAFDEDYEIFIHLGLLGFLAGFIWFMNSKWSWQEVLIMLDSMLSVVLEGLLPNYS